MTSIFSFAWIWEHEGDERVFFRGCHDACKLQVNRYSVVSITHLPLPLYTTPDTINDQAGSAKRPSNIWRPIDLFEPKGKRKSQNHVLECL